MKKYQIIISAIIGTILAVLYGTRKSDRDMNYLKKEGQRREKTVDEWKRKTEVSKVKANETLKEHRASYGDNVDDTISFIERGEKPPERGSK